MCADCAQNSPDDGGCQPQLGCKGADSSLPIMVVTAGYAGDIGGLEPMTFCIQDGRFGGDAWVGCRGRGIADGPEVPEEDAPPPRADPREQALPWDMRILQQTGVV